MVQNKSSPSISNTYLIFPIHTSHRISLGSDLNFSQPHCIHWAQDMIVVASSKEHAAVTYAPADQELLGFWHVPEAWETKLGSNYV